MKLLYMFLDVSGSHSFDSRRARKDLFWLVGYKRLFLHFTQHLTERLLPVQVPVWMPFFVKRSKHPGRTTHKKYKVQLVTACDS